MKQIPESFSLFETIIRNNYVYIDKTEYIKRYEDTGVMVSMFLRPRRFGKTMFTEIMRYYYDKAMASKFDELFKTTWIASHPTPLKNSYNVLKFDFSGVQSNIDITTTMKFFRRQTIRGIKSFCRNYPELFSHKVQLCNSYSFTSAVDRYYSDTERFVSAADVLSDFLDSVSDELDSSKLMVIIDEYDNFTNDILSRDPGVFADLARKEGDIGAFYGVLRNFNQSEVIERIFVTGVLPVTMDTAVSGFVFRSISDKPSLNSLAGFTRSEILDLLRETVDFEKCSYSPEALSDIITERYDGYRFDKFCSEGVSNAALCLGFVSNLIDGRYNIPELNISSVNDIDYVKLSGYLDLIQEQDRERIISAITRNRLIPFEFPGSVKVSHEHAMLDKNESLSILFHLGFLTLAGADEMKKARVKNMARDHLRVPNEYFRRLFAKYIFQKRSLDWSVFSGTYDFSGMAAKNDLATLRRFLKAISQAFVNCSSIPQGESQVTLAVYTALNLIPGSPFKLTREYAIRHNGQYVFPDENDDDYYDDADADEDGSSNGNDDNAAAVKVNVRSGRADLAAENRTGKGPSYLFEVKYARDVPAGEDTKARVREKLLNDAVTQLDFYVTDDDLRTLKDLRRYALLYAYGEFLLKEV
jgi:hypothetical protein